MLQLCCISTVQCYMQTNDDSSMRYVINCIWRATNYKNCCYFISDSVQNGTIAVVVSEWIRNVAHLWTYYTFGTQQCQWKYYVFRLPSTTSVSYFVRTDLSTTISRERLEQSWWSLKGMLPLRMTWLDSGGHGDCRPLRRHPCWCRGIEVHVLDCFMIDDLSANLILQLYCVLLQRIRAVERLIILIAQLIILIVR